MCLGITGDRHKFSGYSQFKTEVYYGQADEKEKGLFFT